MKFEKWQALGNDYVIVEAENLPGELNQERVKRICDPHFGVGSDGVLLISESADPDLVAELRIFNPDGSEAELSGNGAREAILYLRRHGWTDLDHFTIMTGSGPVTPRIMSDRVCAVHLGTASTASDDYPSGPEDGLGSVASAGRDWNFRHISIGNPQCAIEAGADLEDLNLPEIGPDIENSGLFPNRTNVSFFRASGSRVRARIFERGVGETLSSGTGATGAAIAAYLNGAVSPITVELDGGELLVEITPELEVTLTGWAEPILSGELVPELVESIFGPTP